MPTYKVNAAALQDSLPEACRDAPGRGSRGRKEAFKPQMTTGQARNKAELDNLKALGRQVLLQDGADCLEALLDRLQLMVKPKGRPGPYVVYSGHFISSSQMK